MQRGQIAVRFGALVAAVLWLAGCEGRSTSFYDLSTVKDAFAASELVGYWSGYVESYSFPSGSDAIGLDVNEGSMAGQLQATATFGKGQPPPLDPDRGFPKVNSPYVIEQTTYIQEGFVFHVRDLLFAGKQLRFSVARGEQWQQWCEAQTPVKDEVNGKYRCTPNWPVDGDGEHCYLVNPADNSTVEYDCARLGLCGSVCACSSTSCTVDLSFSEFTFDFILDDNMLVGNGLLDGKISHNIRLMRAEKQ